MRSPFLMEYMPLAVNVSDEAFRSNIRSAVQRDLPWLQPCDAHDGQAVVCGGGPSLADSLDEIRWRASIGQHVFATNNTARWLIERGVTPHALVLLDARPSNARFVAPGVKCYLASQCAPETFDAAKDNDTVLFHPNVAGVAELIGGRECALVGGGTTVGLAALSIVYILGYRKIHPRGFDSSYRGNDGHAYAQPENANDEVIEVQVNGRWFRCARWMAHQADEFKHVLYQLTQADCEVTIAGDGMLPHIARLMMGEEPGKSNVGIGYFDCGQNPTTFNYLDFLMQLERWRIREGLERVEIKVLPGPKDGFRDDDLPPYGASERARWLRNIVLPMSRLLPSCGAEAELVDRTHTTDLPQFGRNEYTVGPSTWIEAFRDGEYPFTVPPEFIVKRRPYVTITLRNTGWWTERSSDFAQWTLAARSIERAGYDVVVIPDGARPDETLPGFQADTLAAENVLQRVGLYAGAQMNLGIANGPMWLCWFLGLPTMICKIVNENEPCAGAEMWKSIGVAPGTQPPHARPKQRLVWDTDRTTTILRHFYELMRQEQAA